MKKLEVGKEIILYNIVRETTGTKKHLGGISRTFVGENIISRTMNEVMANILSKKNSMRLYFLHDIEDELSLNIYKQEVKPVAIFRVRRLHNNDPITII